VDGGIVPCEDDELVLECFFKHKGDEDYAKYIFATQVGRATAFV
jgi:hypothetical protein